MVFVSMEKPKNGTGPLNARVVTKPIHIPAAVHTKAKIAAAREGITLGQYTENALRQFAMAKREAV